MNQLLPYDPRHTDTRSSSFPRDTCGPAGRRDGEEPPTRRLYVLVHTTRQTRENNINKKSTLKAQRRPRPAQLLLCTGTRSRAPQVSLVLEIVMMINHPLAV